MNNEKGMHRKSTVRIDSRFVILNDEEARYYAETFDI